MEIGRRWTKRKLDVEGCWEGEGEDGLGGGEERTR